MSALKQPSSPVVVLVPGAWHTGQAYDLLASPIREKGYEPFPIQLPTVGISPGLTDFSADVAAIRSHVTSIIDQDNRDVVLVMHSYSACPGTEAMRGLGKKERKAAGKETGVIALVYIAAIVPTKGFTCSSAEIEEVPNKLKLKDNGDGTVLVENPIELFYHDVAPSVAEAAVKEIRTHSSGSFGSPLTYEAYRDITSGYLFCELDRAISLSRQRRLADSAGIKIRTTVQSAHSPFLTCPQQVVDFIIQVAENGAQAQHGERTATQRYSSYHFDSSYNIIFFSSEAKIGHTAIVQNLIDLLWEVDDLNTAVKNALEHEIPELETYGITSAKGFLDFADSLVTEWIPTETAKGKDIFYIICLFYFVLSQEPFGHRQTKIVPQSLDKKPLLTPISQWVVNFAKQVGAHLDTEKSINEASFNTFRNSPIYHVNEAIVPQGGFKTFNQFFARHLKPGMRPIAEPENDNIIVFPADSSFAGAWGIDEKSEVVLKNVPWPVAKLIDDTPHADAFSGGVWMHSFLNTFDYHRQHAPVSGEVIEAKVIQGAAYLEVLVKTDEVTGVKLLAPSRIISDDSRLVVKGLDAPDTPGYQFLQTRGLIIIDNPKLGKVAILPIGMAHVSSVILSVKKGDHIKKGDEISYFQFGGSDCVMLFEAKAAVTGFPNSQMRTHFNYGEKLATAHPMP